MSSAASPPPFGVNVFGYLHAESGMGEQGRQLVHAIRQTGIPYAAVPYTRTLTRQNHRFTDPSPHAPGFPINIAVINADEFPHFAADVGEDFLSSRYTIGIWAWEIEEFPASMARSERFLDEVWAISEFGAQAIRRQVDRPVLPFPVPVTVPNPATTPRLAMELPDGFVFLFCFDFDSIFERKNPIALVHAFRQAFPEQEQVSLIIKSINGSRAPAKLDKLRSSTDDDQRIQIIDEYWEAGQMQALMAACDAYVSLHRSEGFGLTMAEAMALGKPVIATAYSGNLDFMNEENSYLVKVDSVPVPGGCEPYRRGALWSEPDIDEAAALMRRVVAAPEEARAKAARGRAEIERHHSTAARSRYVKRRLEEIAQSDAYPAATESLPDLSSRFFDHQEIGEPVRSPTAQGGDPTSGIEEAIANLAAHLEEGPDLRRPTRLGRPGLWFRRLMFRLMRNYHLYQLQVGRSMVTVLRGLARELDDARERSGQLDQRLAKLEQRLAKDLERRDSARDD